MIAAHQINSTGGTEVVLQRDVDRSSPEGSVDFDGSFEVTHRHFDEASVLDVRGELDLANASTLGVAVNQALARKPRRLVIDLNRVPFIDPRGLSVLLGARRRALYAGIELRLACDVGSTLRLLALTRLDRNFDVRPTRAAALSPQAGPA